MLLFEGLLSHRQDVEQQSVSASQGSRSSSSHHISPYSSASLPRYLTHSRHAPATAVQPLFSFQISDSVSKELSGIQGTLIYFCVIYSTFINFPH